MTFAPDCVEGFLRINNNLTLILMHMNVLWMVLRDLLMGN